MTTSEEVMRALKAVYDPEIGINIVDLGLVYGATVEDATVKIDMTLTSPACPLAGRSSRRRQRDPHLELRGHRRGEDQLRLETTVGPADDGQRGRQARAGHLVVGAPGMQQ